MTNFKNLADREDFASTRERFKDDQVKDKEDFSKIADRLEVKLMEFKSDILNFMLFLYIITLIAILGLYLNH